MSVRFKFRSSSTFESIDIGAQSSISIRDLKSEIVKKKHLNLCQDFDLVFSDSFSGQEYKDESVQIPSGSSVVIKRVPAASTSSFWANDASARCSGAKESNHVNTVVLPAVNDGSSVFDDFGADLCPLPDANLHDLGKVQSHDSKKGNCIVPRCSEELLVRCHKLDATPPSQCTPKDYSANDNSTLMMHPKPKTEEQTHQLERTYHANNATERNDVPSEMKCSLCRNFFEEAVMIPCCQHSFCEKCICLALSENKNCPMCSSTKCKAGDLLPNVSLRQAIKRFLQSQLLDSSENDLYRCAPDGESGIQAELSCTATHGPRDSQLNPCAPGKRPNHIMQNKLLGHTHLADMLCKPGHGALEDSSEYQGENDPQSRGPTDEEGCYTKKEGECCVITGGKKRNFAAPGRQKMGQRTCYMCGSPDHLIRDCPVAANSRTKHWNGDFPGCAPPYWPGSTTNARPFLDMYGGSGMMYNATMPPISSFVYPSYAPSVYPIYPVPSGHMQLGVGSMARPTGINGPQPRHVEFLHDHVKQQRNCNANLGRELIIRRVENIGLQHDKMERGVNHSNDRHARWTDVNHRSCNNSDNDTYSYSERQDKLCQQEEERGLRVSGSERSTFEENMSDRRIHDIEDRHEKHHRSSRTNDERRVLYGSDTKRESIKRRKLEQDQRKSDKRFHSISRSSIEHSNSSDGTRQRREELSHRSRHSRKSSKSNDEYHYDREKMIKYSDDDYEEHYHGHKRKRFH